MSKKRNSGKSPFAGKVADNAKRTKTGGSSNQKDYLNLPQGYPIFKEKGGTSGVLLDVIPYTVSTNAHPDRRKETGSAIKGSLWFKRPIKVHRSVGLENEDIICPTSIGKPCPICDKAKRMKANDEDYEDYSPLFPSNRTLYNVIPIQQKGFKEIPHIWDISDFCFYNKLKEELLEDERNEIFPDLKNGKTLKCRFSEESMPSKKGKPTVFGKASRIDFVERDYEYDDDIMDDALNLDKIILVKSYEEIKELFYSSGPDEMAEENVEIEEEEDDFVPAASRRKKKTTGHRKQPVPEEDTEEIDDVELDDDIDDVEFDDDLEGDEVVDDVDLDDDEIEDEYLEEDDFDDDDDEVVEEKPVRKKRTTRTTTTGINKRRRKK